MKRKATKQKKRRAKVGTVDGMPMNPKLREAFEKEGLLPASSGVAAYNGPVRIVLDNTVPGGTRLEPAL